MALKASTIPVIKSKTTSVEEKTPTPSSTASEITEEKTPAPSSSEQSDAAVSPTSQRGGVGVSGATVSPTVEYYIRQNDQWIKDDKITNDIGGIEVTPAFFCNLQDQCIIDKQSGCINMEESKENIDKETLQAIYAEFDETYGEKEDELKSRIDNMLLSSIDRIKYLKKQVSVC